ncbi:transmembrane protein 81 [Tachysurus fulvidraco]|uniref:transmembrane protein 81 n=1 Tax=Tachysurus fulvidraco TaxID=1234273 RepID=UPI001FEDC060|nr:transmembrane protein 81 [Tachysurus fulvidraco]
MRYLALFLIVLHFCSQCEAFRGVDLEDLASNNTWVITYSSGCSTTCGLGIRTQRLCPLGTDPKANSPACRVRQVQCLDKWQCGLQLQTVTAGQFVELDCFEEVMEAMGRFAFAVSWHFARGIITTNNRFFIQRDVPGLDRIVLNRVKEEDAGTYRCDVLDTSYRRVKRMYKGLKVLSANVLNLKFTEGLTEWEKPIENNITVVTGKLYPRGTVQKVVLLSFCISISTAMIVFLGLFAFSYCKRSTRKDRISP